MASTSEPSLNGTVCSAFEREPVLFPSLSRFRNTPTIERAHSVPRFNNRPSDLIYIWDGTEDELSGYIKGVTAVSITIFGFVFSWMVLLLVFKCCGYKRVGLLAGTRLYQSEPPPQPEDIDDCDERRRSEEESSASIPNIEENGDGEKNSIGEEKKDFDSAEEQGRTMSENDDLPVETTEHDEGAALVVAWQSKVEAEDTVLQRLRIAVLLFGGVIVLAAILMVALGIDSMSDSIWQVRRGLAKAENLALDAVDLIEGFWRAQQFSTRRVDQYREALNGICPNVREAICISTLDTTTCNFTDIPLANVIREALESSKRSIFLELFDLREDLLETAEIFRDFEQTASSMNWAFWIAASYAILLALLTILIMYSVVLAWKKKRSRIRTFVGKWFVVPVYIFLVFSSWIFSMVFMLGATASADMCIDSPDSRILAFLEKNRDKFSSTIYEFATFYVGGCDPDDYPFNLRNTVDLLLEVLSVFYKLAQALGEADPVEFMRVCGSSAGDFSGFTVAVEEGICLTAQTLIKVDEFFSCSNWHPVYATVMYNAFCYEGNAGFAWIASTQLIIVIFAMLMVTARVAFQTDGSDSDSPSTHSKPDAILDSQNAISENQDSQACSEVSPMITSTE